MNYNYFWKLVLIIWVIIFIPTVITAQDEKAESKPTNEQKSKVRQKVEEAKEIVDEGIEIAEKLGTLWEKLETIWKKSEKQKSSSQEKHDSGLSCPRFTKPVFNPYNITFDDINTPPCSIFPVIDVAKDTTNVRYAQSKEEYFSIRKFDNADQLVVVLYIINGADVNLHPTETAARNVKIKTSITSNGNLHRLTATFTGDNITPITGSVNVQTNPDEYLEVYPNSGFMYTYDGRIIGDQQRLNLGNSIFTLGSLHAGMEYSLFFTFKVKVMKKQ